MKKNLFALVAMFVLGISCVVYFGAKAVIQRWKGLVRDQMRQEIRMAVREEMTQYLASADQNPDQGMRVARHDSPVDSASSRSALQSEVHSAFQEAFESELDRYAAGQSLAAPISLGGANTVSLSISDPDLSVITGAGDSSSENTTPENNARLPGDDASAGTEKRNPSVDRALVNRGGMLLPYGRNQIEAGFALAHTSANAININGFSILPVLVIGEISVDEYQRDIFIQTMGFKRAILPNLQAEIRIPSRFHYERVTNTTTGEESIRKEFGLGDIDVSVSRQISWEHGIVPDSLVNLSFKTITGEDPYDPSGGTKIGLGTGHYALRGSIVGVKSSDPAVVFGNMSYTWNIPRDIDNFGDVDPGDTVGYVLGVGIGLSYQTAISLSFDHSVTFKMIKDGYSVEGSFLQVANLKMGLTWSISDRSSMDFTVTAGLTTDSPDFVVEIRFPYTF